MHNLYRSLASVAPAVDIQSIQKFNGGYQVVLSVVYEDTPFEAVAKAFENVFDGKLTIVEGSQNRIVHTKNINLWRAVAVANTESIEYSPESVKNMRVQVANVFMDADDNIWKLVGDGEKRLVKSNTEDLDKILASKASRMKVAASYVNKVEALDGDYVYFYNTNKGEMDFGHVVASLEKPVVVLKDLTTVAFDPDAVVEAADLDFEKHTAAEVMEFNGPNTVNVQAFLDYYGLLFKDTAFYKAYEAMIREHAGK